MMDVEKLRMDIAAKHNILLPKDDPIFVAVMINHVVLEEYLEIVNRQNVSHQEVMARALNEAVVRSKEIAGVIITQSAEYVSDQINNAVNAALEDATERNKALLSEVIHVRNEARYYVIFCVVCAVGAVISAAVASY